MLLPHPINDVCGPAISRLSAQHQYTDDGAVPLHNMHCTADPQEMCSPAIDQNPTLSSTAVRRVTVGHARVVDAAELRLSWACQSSTVVCRRGRLRAAKLQA